MPPKRRGRGRGRGCGNTQDEATDQKTHSHTEERRPGIQTAKYVRAPAPCSSSSSSCNIPFSAEETRIFSAKKRDGKEALEASGFRLEQKSEPLALAKRRDHGTVGKTVRLKANYFPIQIPSGDVFHYDVDIQKTSNFVEPLAEAVAGGGQQPKPKNKIKRLNCKRKRDVMAKLVTEHKNFKALHPAFDGKKNLYTRKPLGDSVTKVIYNVEMEAEENPSKRDVYHVEIKPVNAKNGTCAVSLDSIHEFYNKTISNVPEEAFQALQTVLNHTPSLKFTPVGLSFFLEPKQGDRQSLGGGLEIWFGYHQSVRLGEWGPHVNLDVAATAFYESGPVLCFVYKKLGYRNEAELRRPLNFKSIDTLRAELNDVKVEVRHLKCPRKYRVSGVTDDGADRLLIEPEKGSRKKAITVFEYFKSEHNIELKYRNLPCLRVHPMSRKVYLPIELCFIVPGQPYKSKLEQDQIRNMIRLTKKFPGKRFGEIKSIRRDESNFNQFPVVKEFDICVENELLKLEGKVLPSPTLLYKENVFQPNQGTWDMRGKVFFEGVEIKSWVLLCLAEGVELPHLRNFCNSFIEIGRNSGISMGQPASIDRVQFSKTDMKKLFMQKTRGADLTLIVIPERDRDNKKMYRVIKQVAETELGIKTQCILSKNVLNCSPSLLANLFLKINAKLGGVNSFLDRTDVPEVFKRPIMIIGADVNHSPPTKFEDPKSFAACVGSLDRYISNYASVTRSQRGERNKKSVEIIRNLEEMVAELLLAFFRRNRKLKPEKIIFYRDGVSEAEMYEVRDYEVSAIRRACKSVQKDDYEPGITYLVVQKRHHTRFIVDGAYGRDRQENVEPGTTVDRVVTHPVDWDFFLCSHRSPQGTSRPSHYKVVTDDNNFTSDEIYKITYYLCYLYVRCTKSISVPAPVMYAHLAAYRARLLNETNENSGRFARPDYFSDKDVEMALNVRKDKEVKQELKESMFFV